MLLVRNQRLFYLAGALSPILFFGLWWVLVTPMTYWLLKRTMAILPTSAAVAAAKAREEESLFFLAALGGSLKAGLPLLSALSNVTSLLATSLKIDINRVYSLLLLGAEPSRAWATLREDRMLSQLSISIASAQNDGRPLSSVVERAATLCYENSLKRSKERVKSLSVKLALPIGLCFLPSFLIGAIGPIVYSFFTSLHFY